MRIIVLIFGTLLIAAIVIISGSAIAPWVTWIDEDNTTNTDYIDGSPDDDHASLGQDGTPPVLGWVLLDLDLYAMGPSHDFTVWADSTLEENYSVYVGETRDVEAMTWIGDGSDTQDEDFQTPALPSAALYRYIFMEGTSGITSFEDPDWAYGPDIDAVGWY